MRPAGLARAAPATATVAALAIALAGWSCLLPSLSAAATSPDTALSAAPTAMPPALPAPRLGGYIQAREVAQERVGLTTFLNRARFSLDGSQPSKFTYRALVEMQASAGARNPATVSLREAIVKWSPAPFALTSGEFKTPSRAST